MTNYFIYDIFLFIEISNVCNLAKDNTLLSCGDYLSLILKSLEHDGLV